MPNRECLITPTLDLVRQGRLRVQVVDGPHAKHAKQLLRLLSAEFRIGRRVNIVSSLIDEVRHAGVQVELPRLLFQRHAPQQVPDALINGKIEVSVWSPRIRIGSRILR